MWAFYVLPLVLLADDVRPQSRAHAHNDYAHGRPLADALSSGFCSVEADIFLRDGQLLVGHTSDELRSDRTLETLYLSPLRDRSQNNGGRIYAQVDQFWLLIDIKTDGPATYRALHAVLERYGDLLTTYRSGTTEKKAVTVVISGNRPRELIEEAEVRYAGVDGRLSDLDSAASPSLLPWISDNWTLNFRWRGEGPFPDDERQKLREIVAKAHERKRLVRFWATPDRSAIWQELVAADVDLINTDDLQGLSKFLTENASKTE